jgi:hypothetical protein
MAKLNFREGIVRYPTVSQGGPFVVVSGNRVDISSAVLNVPVQATIAYLNQNYLIQNTNPSSTAWGSGNGVGPNNNAPFTTVGSYYLYWDVDFVTGEIAYDYTTVAPVFGPTAPSSPVADQHWFDTANFIMKVRVGSSWIDTLRVFAATYTGGGSGGLSAYALGSQVSITNVTAYAGYILFDDEQKPLRRYRGDRKVVFIHTETPLSTTYETSGGIASFRLDAVLFSASAVESIAAYQPVAFQNPGKLVLARNTTPTLPAIGIAAEDMTSGQYKSYIPTGFVQNISWDWDVFDTQPPNTPLFVSADGELTTTVPQTGSVQQIGYIVDAVTIYVQPQQVITYG